MKKILLLHGWNWRNYSKFGTAHPWSNREAFFDAIKDHFKVISPSFPGFCEADEPHHSWGIDDYALFIGSIVEKERPDVILGYSFGGAVATHWKFKNRDSKVPLILVSPAIIRKYEYSNSRLKNFIINLGKNMSPFLISKFRHLYLKYWIKNPYYIHGTSFLRKSYSRIAGVDLGGEISLMDPSGLLMIFGEQDTATPPLLMKKKLPEKFVSHMKIIQYGGHDIANSHTDELVKYIRDFAYNPHF